MISMVRVLIHTDTRYPVNRKVIRQAVLDVFKKYKIEDIDAEVSVAVVGERKMRQLCADYLKDDGGHAVLAFPLEGVYLKTASATLDRLRFVNPPDSVLRLGDVLLSWPQVLAKAAADNILVDVEVALLVGHGVKQLLGGSDEGIL